MNADEIRQILTRIKYPQYNWIVGDSGGRMYLQAYYSDTDIVTGALDTQYTRKWNISNQATTSEVVQTAFKCILTSAEHRVREHFKYKGERIYGPHFSADFLARALQEKRGACLDYRGKDS